jgi:hypothetical protein
MFDSWIVAIKLIECPWVACWDCPINFPSNSSGNPLKIFRKKLACWKWIETKINRNFPIDCISKKSSKKFHSKGQIVSLEFLDFFFSFVQLERELARTSGKQLKSWIKNWNWNWWIELGVDLKEKMKSQKSSFRINLLVNSNGN